MSDYSDKRLEYLANADLIWPQKSPIYAKLVKESIEAKGWDYHKLNDPGQSNDLHPDQLWYDLCEMINNLAQEVLDERKKTSEIVSDLKQELKRTIKSLENIAYK